MLKKFQTKNKSLLLNVVLCTRANYLHRSN